MRVRLTVNPKNSPQSLVFSWRSISGALADWESSAASNQPRRHQPVWKECGECIDQPPISTNWCCIWASKKTNEKAQDANDKIFIKELIQITIIDVITLLKKYCSFRKLEFLLTMKNLKAQLKNRTFCRIYRFFHVCQGPVFLSFFLTMAMLTIRSSKHISMMLPLKDSWDCKNFPIDINMIFEVHHLFNVLPNDSGFECLLIRVLYPVNQLIYNLL